MEETDTRDSSQEWKVNGSQNIAPEFRMVLCVRTYIFA